MTDQPTPTTDEQEPVVVPDADAYPGDDDDTTNQGDTPPETGGAL